LRALVNLCTHAAGSTLYIAMYHTLLQLTNADIPFAAVDCALQLMPETLYLTCNIIDRYLSTRNVTRKRLQLVSKWQ
jgi:hypothetical protein